MKKRMLFYPLLLLGFLFCSVACHKVARINEEQGDTSRVTVLGETGMGGDGIAFNAVDSEVDSDRDVSTSSACYPVMEYSGFPPRVVILLDRSGSMGSIISNEDGTMNTAWELAKSAIREIVTAYDSNVAFGFDVFPRDDHNDVGSSILLDVAPENGDAVLDELSMLQPNGGTPFGDTLLQYARAYTDCRLYDGSFDAPADTPLAIEQVANSVDNACPLFCTTICDDTKTWNAIGTVTEGTCNSEGMQCCDMIFADDIPDNHVLQKYAPVFMNGDGTDYLIVVSDGVDSAFGESDFSEITRLILEYQNIRTIAVGFGSGASEPQLNAIASHGGTSFTDFLQADDGDALHGALETIVEQVANGCRYYLGDLDHKGVDDSSVSVFFDGNIIPGDDSACAGGIGWMWTDDTHTGINLCELTCIDFKAGMLANMEIRMDCP